VTSTPPLASLNFADVWERVAEAIPDAPALVHGSQTATWRQFDSRASAIASALVANGLTRQEKVAQYLYNCNEYLESVFAAVKASLVPVNTNYRYGPSELSYLWENSDTACVVFHGIFMDTIERVRGRGSGVRLWVWIDDGSGPCPEWAESYEDLIERHSASAFVAEAARSASDLLLLYTGGTTGLPKGVMWQQGDLCRALGQLGYGESENSIEPPAQPGPVWLPSSPLMHGTGGFAAYQGLFQGGSIVTLTSRTFDPRELLDTVDQCKVEVLGIVGDTFAKPIVRSIEEDPKRWNLGSLKMIASSGTMWSEHIKARLIDLLPEVTLSDSFSSSESLRMGVSLAGKNATAYTAQFQAVANAKVFADDGSEVQPGSGLPGRVAVTGLLPIGYYNDPEKTAQTFVEIDGVRYSIPGDYATVDASGVLHLLGRGSACINTGGEKVFPEEVEETLKEHPAIQDAAVVGIPDERFGEVVVAVVELAPRGECKPSVLIEHVKSELASYKAPKWIVFAPRLERSPNGKVDYAAARALVSESTSPKKSGLHR
jgi:3-oxocholest-4-en-26-oate---CoA ligase